MLWESKGECIHPFFAGGKIKCLFLGSQATQAEMAASGRRNYCPLTGPLAAGGWMQL